jgi:predicted TIM-barrel fold metal-dependent hydrolase
VHVHVEQDGQGCFALDQELLDASAAYFRADQDRTPTVEAIADYYRARRTAAVIFTVDAPAGTGHPALSSEEIAERAAAHPDVLIPFGSVDPHAGKADFPDLQIVLAHPSVPWQDEAISIATPQGQRLHRPVRLVAEVLPSPAGPGGRHPVAPQGVVRLGLPGDHPGPVAGRLREDRDRDEVRPLILKDNAARLLGLDS